jgi:hypothetical protein
MLTETRHAHPWLDVSSDLRVTAGATTQWHSQGQWPHPETRQQLTTTTFSYSGFPSLIGILPTEAGQVKTPHQIAADMGRGRRTSFVPLILTRAANPPHPPMPSQENAPNGPTAQAPTAAPAGPKGPQQGPPQARAPEGASGRPKTAAPAGPKRAPARPAPSTGPRGGQRQAKTKREGGRHRQTGTTNMARWGVQRSQQGTATFHPMQLPTGERSS